MYDNDPALQALRRAASNPASRWPSPTNTGEGPSRLVPEAWPVLKPRFLLKRSDTAFTVGSCFARNIERYLDQFGLKVPMLDFTLPEGELEENRPQAIMNKYTPPSIYQEFKRTADLFDATPEVRKAHFAELMLEVSGGVVDLELGGRTPVTMERALARREEVFQLFKHAFTADVVIITLGLIECWWDTERNAYVHPMPPIKELGRKNARFVFRQLRYQEAHDYIRKTIELVKERGREDTRILITTSPVPLNATFTDADVLLANTYSKSMLRTVAGEIYREFPHVDYFPSYESVTLTRTDNVWNKDLIHVSDAFVGKIVDNLLRAYLPEGAPTDEESLGRAVALLKMHDHQAALTLLEGLTEISPRVNALRAFARLECGDKKALPELQKAVPAADLHGEEFVLISRKFVECGAQADAANLLARAVESDEIGQAEKVGLLLRLARLRRGLKDKTGVQAALAEAERIAPKRMSVMREAATQAIAAKDPGRAVHYLDLVIAAPRFRTLKSEVKEQLMAARKVQAKRMAKQAE